MPTVTCQLKPEALEEANRLLDGTDLTDDDYYDEPIWYADRIFENGFVFSLEIWRYRDVADDGEPCFVKVELWDDDSNQLDAEYYNGDTIDGVYILEHEGQEYTLEVVAEQETEEEKRAREQARAARLQAEQERLDCEQREQAEAEARALATLLLPVPAFQMDF